MKSKLEKILNMSEGCKKKKKPIKEASKESMPVVVVTYEKVKGNEPGLPSNVHRFKNFKEASKYFNISLYGDTKDFTGPMEDGGKLRFEDWKSYDFYSR